MASAQAGTADRSVAELLTMIDRDQIMLPEIQREFVWTKTSIKLPVDSMCKGLPIGSMLLWKPPPEPVPTKAFDGQRRLKGNTSAALYGYLLDGQQRLTALMHLRDRDERYPLMYQAWPERDAEDAFYWRGKHEPESPWAIPVSETLREGFDVAKRLDAIRKDNDFKPKHGSEVLRGLTALGNLRSYNISTVEFRTDDPKVATELFVRFNSTGRRLRRSDLSIAQLALHVPDLASARIRPARTKWKNFSFSMPFLVQCLLAVHTRRLKFKDPEKFWQGEKLEEVTESQRRTERAIDRLVEFLTGTVRWQSGGQIPSYNALIPLIVALAHGAAWTSTDRRLARRWLHLACVRGTFSGAAQTQLDRVLRQIGDEPTVTKLWEVTGTRLPRLQPADFATGRLSGPIMSLYLSMLRNVQAADWKERDTPLDGTVVGDLAALQVAEAEFQDRCLKPLGHPSRF